MTDGELQEIEAEAARLAMGSGDRAAAIRVIAAALPLVAEVRRLRAARAMVREELEALAANLPMDPPEMLRPTRAGAAGALLQALLSEANRDLWG